MAKCVLASLMAILAITSISRAQTTILLDDFSTDTMADTSATQKTGDYQYQYLDANWASTYGKGQTLPVWRIENGVIHCTDNSKTTRFGHMFTADFSSNPDPANWSIQFEWIAGHPDKISDFDMWVGKPKPDYIPANDEVIWQLYTSQSTPDPNSQMAEWVHLTPSWTWGIGPFTSGQIVDIKLDVQSVLSDASLSLEEFSLLAFSYQNEANHALTTLDNFMLCSESDIVSGPQSDANGDGIVDAADYIIFKQNFGASPGVGGAGAAVGDFNDDGTVDMLDLAVYAQELGTASQAVPEPATIGLLAVGAFGFIRRRRRS